MKPIGTVMFTKCDLTQLVSYKWHYRRFGGRPVTIRKMPDFKVCLKIWKIQSVVKCEHPAISWGLITFMFWMFWINLVFANFDRRHSQTSNCLPVAELRNRAASMPIVSNLSNSVLLMVCTLYTIQCSLTDSLGMGFSNSQRIDARQTGWPGKACESKLLWGGS